MPLGHSFSQKYFTDKFTSEGIIASYSNFPMETVEPLTALIRSHPELCGLNVTVPHKSAVIPLLDYIDADAAAIGAVNVIKIEHHADGKIITRGYNSDWIGFRDSILPFINFQIPHKALVLGTGGASKAVCHALKSIGVEVTLVSRRPADNVLTYSDLDSFIMTTHNIIVNTTPLGMWPRVDASPDIPYHLVDGRHLCIDIVYNPAVTQFMDKCAARGATVKNGLEMLTLQAIRSWEIWNSKLEL